MALEMLRHVSGILYTPQFADFLRTTQRAEQSGHPGELLSLEYVSCVEGAQAGTAWWKLAWISCLAAPSEHQCVIGETGVFIHRQSRRGLKNRLLHYSNGQVVVKS
jgi:hypothetical protein